MEENIYIQFIETPLGWLKLKANKEELKAILFVDKEGESSREPPSIIADTMLQLEEYFKGTRKTFNVKLAAEGTEFQQKVWNIVSKIEFGKTASYLSIAIKTGSEKNTRAVGLANGKNPIPIIIPCHRVLGINGKLTGYAGGLERKRWLLQHELSYTANTNLLF